MSWVRPLQEKADLSISTVYSPLTFNYSGLFFSSIQVLFSIYLLLRHGQPSQHLLSFYYLTSLSFYYTDGCVTGRTSGPKKPYPTIHRGSYQTGEGGKPDRGGVKLADPGSPAKWSLNEFNRSIKSTAV